MEAFDMRTQEQSDPSIPPWVIEQAIKNASGWFTPRQEFVSQLVNTFLAGAEKQPEWVKDAAKNADSKAGKHLANAIKALGDSWVARDLKEAAKRILAEKVVDLIYTSRIASRSEDTDAEDRRDFVAEAKTALREAAALAVATADIKTPGSGGGTKLEPWRIRQAAYERVRRALYSHQPNVRQTTMQTAKPAIVHDDAMPF